MEKNHFTSLTGLRTIAASMVFFHHFNPFEKETFLFDFVNEFHIGVTIFFVLSGFLIGFRYSDKTIDKRQYFVNRFARIYPVFFIITLATFIFYPTTSKFDLFLNFTLLKGVFENYKFSGVAQGWTLTVEESFYIFALLLFFLARKVKIILIAFLPFILVFIGLIAQMYFSEHDLRSFLNNTELVLNYTFFGRSFEFISGFLLSYFLPKLKFNFKHFTFIGIVGLVLSIFLLMYFKGSEDFGIRTFQGKLINNYFLPLFGILPLIFGFISEKTIISKVLSTNIFELLGKSSYSFYLVHMGVVQIWISSYVQSYYVLFIIMQILSIIIFKVIEEPFNLGIKNIYKTYNNFIARKKANHTETPFF